jgi:uncharacterized PurR-regulated membrane protein YhhQ (DUF165 family)
VKRLGFVCLAVFIATIPLANWTTDTYGFRDVLWIGMIPAGTVWISVSFVARDVTQLTLGRVWALVGIGIGAVLSIVLANPGLVWGSFVAFTVSELLDMGIYTPLADRGKFALAVLLSSVVGGVLDSWLFLRIAFGEEVAADGWWRLAIAKAVIILLVTPLAILIRRRMRAVPSYQS